MKSTFAMLGLLLLLCGGAFWLLGFEPDDGGGATPHVPPEPVPVAPDAAGGDPGAPEEPEVSPEKEQIAELIALLRSEDAGGRRRGVVGLGKIGAAAKEALPLLEEIIRNETGTTRYHAMTAYMRIAGDRRWYRELAEAAASPAGRGRSPAYKIYRGFDEANARAILVALNLRDRGTGRDAPPPGLSAFLDRFFEDEAAGYRELGERVAGATAAELDPWFRVVRLMKPMPAALAPALKRQLLEGGDGEKKHVVGLLYRSSNDASGLRESMVPFVREQAEKADEEWRSAFLSTLGNLGADDPASLEALRKGLASGSEVADGAVQSLARLGVRARPALAELIRSAEAREPGTRSWHIAALLATEDRRAIPFFAKVLVNGYYSEVRAILAKVYAVEGAEALAPTFLALFPRIGKNYVYKLLTTAARCDPTFSRKETGELLVRALDGERLLSRQYAFSCIPLVEAIPTNAAAALARALVPTPDDRTVSAFRRAVEAAAKLGQDAEPIVPSLLRHVGDVRVQRQVFQALASIAPEERGCLEAFRRYAVEGRTSTARYWCVKGIGAIDEPTAADVALLEKIATSPAERYSNSGKAATEILNRPEWKTLRAE